MSEVNNYGKKLTDDAAFEGFNDKVKIISMLLKSNGDLLVYLETKDSTNTDYSVCKFSVVLCGIKTLSISNWEDMQTGTLSVFCTNCELFFLAFNSSDVSVEICFDSYYVREAFAM